MERDSLIYKTRRKIQTIAYKILPHDLLSKIYFKIVLNKNLNLKEPKTFNEKLQWLKLNYFPNNELVVKCTDKYQVRDYIEKKGYKNILNDILGVWDKSEDIEWDKLPDQFVLKCTHGCAYNIICKDKATFDKKKAQKQLNAWLKEDFAAFNVELHYGKIKHRRIICEKYLGEKLIDYKFFCFNGEPQFFYVSSDMANDRQAEMGFFNMDGMKIPLIREDYKDIGDIKMPECLNKMVQTAKELSKEFPFVRVDFFLCQEDFKFAELTFTPGAAMMPINPKEYDVEWGKALELNKTNNELVWKYYNHMIIPEIEPHKMNYISKKDAQKELRKSKALLARWVTEFDRKKKTNFWYCICDKYIPIGQRSSKARYEIRKGLKYCKASVEKINECIEELHMVATESYKTYPKTYRLNIEFENFKNSYQSFNNEEFDLFCCRDIKTGKLMGYAITKKYFDMIDILIEKSIPEMQKYGVNAVLMEEITKEYLLRNNKYKYISDGMRNTLNQTNFQDYLIKYFNFRKAYCVLNIQYKFWVKIMVKILYPFRKLFQATKFDRVRAILKLEEFSKVPKINMKTIGIIGHFGGNKNFTDGQTVKTKEINDYLEKYFHEETIKFDTYKNAKNPFKLIYGINKVMKSADNTIIILSNRGYQIVIKLVYILNMFYKRKTYDFVIGGNRHLIFKDNKDKFLIYAAKNTTKIYVETENMKKGYNESGFKNVEVISNFKNLEKQNEIKKVDKNNFKLCTFSRVCKQKGISEAIEVVKKCNKIMNKNIFSLDIYGVIEEEYKEEFKKLESTNELINYKGMVNFNEASQVLSKYDLLLFLTYWPGEGFPGTIIDAFFSGLPVIATDWNCNFEILKNDYTGIKVDIDPLENIANEIIKLYNNEEMLYEMKQNCLNEADKYLPQNVMQKVIEELEN